ncbi:type II secretion system protein, partial [bacterium]|nr:type II secretion system protein [bacterium]
DTLCIGALLHRRQIFDWKHHALVLISYVKNLRNRRSLLVPLRGFTLVEVLITLGIIGVVAALTIPTLMQKTEEKHIVSQLKKEYTILSQAYNLMQTEYGTIDKWGLSTTQATGEKDEDGNDIYDRSAQELFSERLRKYLNVSQICTTSLNCDNKERYSLNGVKIGDRNTWYKNGTPTFFLSDGTFISIGWFGTGGKFDILVSLPTKEKNLVVGKNEFYFSAFPKGLIPHGTSGAYTTATDSFDSCDKNYSNDQTAGRGCTAWVIYNENMDYLHCRDDLSWDGKTKCD